MNVYPNHKEIKGGKSFRIVSLDYLRGICALGIMIYHLISWSYGHLGANSPLGRFGLYGVSIFYFISGAAMYMAYLNMDFSLVSLKTFFIKRIVRIFPLLWLAIGLTMLGAKKSYELSTVALNFTGLFSILAPSDYIAGGSWSIGNELCFYLIFPVLLYTLRKRVWMAVVAGVVLTLHLSYAYYRIQNISGGFLIQWDTYVEPMNHVLFFFTGMLTGKVLAIRGNNNRFALPVLVVGLLLFAFLPLYEDKSGLISGTGRVVFTILSCSVAFAVSHLSTAKFPPLLDASLRWLGDISYSVYLLHPIVFAAVGILFSVGNAFLPVEVIGWKILITIIGTLTVSHFVYNYYEKTCAKWGKKILLAPYKEKLNKNL